MLSNVWTTATIDDISEKVAMGPFGSSIKVSTFVSEGIPIISGKHLHGFHVDDKPGFNFIGPAHAQKLANANVYRGDVVFTHRGNIGQVAFVPKDSEFHRYVISQSQFYMRCDLSRVIPEFVAMYFRSLEGQFKLLANSSQVGVPSIAQPVSYLRTIEIPLPSLPEQRAIADVFGTLDNKVELNRRMNETLEEMARALFKSWFVDFDPVRAKMEGRWRSGESLPGLPTELYDLFPDRLVHSALGLIPEGWKASALGEVVDHPRRSVGPDQLDPETPLLSLQHMPKKSIALTGWSTASGVGSTKLKFKQGEILFGKLRPYFHKVGVAPVDGVCSTDIVVLAPKGRVWSAFVLGHVSSAAFVDYANRTSTGTRMPRANWKDMSRYDLALPSDSVAKALTAFVAPLIERINVNIHESRKLAGVRDTLLPQLVSGELRAKPKVCRER